MGFPDISSFPPSHPGPYELQMGRSIAALLRLFKGRVSDSESHARVLELAETPDQWSAAHKVFDEVRRRSLAAMKSKEAAKGNQYNFEEACCQAMYNAAMPNDPFDPASAFFVAGAAFGLARISGVSFEDVVKALA